jgi:hypothetical protein
MFGLQSPAPSSALMPVNPQDLIGQQKWRRASFSSVIPQLM